MPLGLLSDPHLHNLNVDRAAGVDLQDRTADAEGGHSGEQGGSGVVVEGVVDVARMPGGGA